MIEGERKNSGFLGEYLCEGLEGVGQDKMGYEGVFEKKEEGQ